MKFVDFPLAEELSAAVKDRLKFYNQMMEQKMNEKEIEQAMKTKGLTAPKVTGEHIDSCIKECTYTVLPSGKVMVCEIILFNGFSVRGEASAVSKANFDIEIGKDISFRNARDKLWQLEGYLLQQKLFEAKDE